MKKSILAILLFSSFTCFADYTANVKSTVNWIKVYNNDTIYFKLSTMPGDHQCKYNYFVLSPDLTDKRRDRYYSMLMTAKVSGLNISVGYDKNNPDCVSDRPVVHALSLS